MELKKGNFYLLQDVSGKKPSSSSFYGTQIFRPFQDAALKNGFNVVAVGQVPANAGQLPMVEFMPAEDVPSAKVQKILKTATKTLKRDLAIRESK